MMPGQHSAARQRGHGFLTSGCVLIAEPDLHRRDATSRGESCTLPSTLLLTLATDPAPVLGGIILILTVLMHLLEGPQMMQAFMWQDDVIGVAKSCQCMSQDDGPPSSGGGFSISPAWCGWNKLSTI